MIIIILLIFFMLSLYFLSVKNYDNKIYSHIYPTDEYPEMKYVYENRKIIQKEFFDNVLKSHNWSNWMEYDKIMSTPIFTHMTREEIINRMFNNKCSLDEGKPSWKLFGLILYKQPIEQNILLCKNTMNILSRCKNIINAGFSCLEPNVITALHRDFNHEILRCHIPIYIPSGNTAIKINNQIKKWSDDDYFIFDDTYDHQAWNYTKEKRIVLIIDILKK